MIVNKCEIFELYNMSMGCYEDEERQKAINFIDSLYMGNGNTHMTPLELRKTLDNILAHVLENTEEKEVETEEKKLETEEEAIEEDTDEVEEETREFGYDFFFN